MFEEDDATKMVETQLAEIRAAFDLFDTDKDGTIDFGELKAALQALKQPASDTDVRKMIALVDENRDGVVNFDEFIHMIEPLDPGDDAEADLRRAFVMLDADGDGYLTAHELRAAISDTRADLSEDEVQQILQASDANGDGRISFEEFRNHLIGH
jgi:calmodulin